MTPFSHISNNAKPMRKAVLVSLFAMMLIYIAPLFSQLQMSTGMMHHSAMPYSMEGMSGDMEGMLGDMGAMRHPASHSTSHATHAMSHHHTGLEAACGYCTLLFHLNWLSAPSFSLPALLQMAYLNYVLAIHGRQSLDVYSAILPRAPPAIVSTSSSYKI